MNCQILTWVRLSDPFTKKSMLLNMMLIFKKFQWEPGNCKAVRLPSIKGKLLERIINS